jgi:hypothetical protein
MKFDVSYENMTIAQFILKYNIGMSVKENRTGKLLNGDPITGWHKDSKHYFITLNYKKKSLEIDFHTGSAIKYPDIQDVLQCLSIDMNCGDYTYEEYSREFGTNIDSIKEKALWKSCVKTSKKLTKFFSNKTLQDFVNIEWY